MIFVTLHYPCELHDHQRRGKDILLSKKEVPRNSSLIDILQSMPQPSLPAFNHGGWYVCQISWGDRKNNLRGGSSMLCCWNLSALLLANAAETPFRSFQGSFTCMGACHTLLCLHSSAFCERQLTVMVPDSQ